jgi:aminodeoxyfutalosine deaminase
VIVRVRARWIVPIVAPVLHGGWVDVDALRGEIVGVGAAGAPGAREPDRVIDLPDAVVLPGLVNAHTHLELSHLAGASPPATDFVQWVRCLMQARSARGADREGIARATRAAVASAVASGTAAVGDIENTADAPAALAASPLEGVIFREALGFRASRAREVLAETQAAAASARAAFGPASGRWRVSTAPHAPYSTSAALIMALAQGWGDARGVSSIHLAESPEEVEFLATGGGPFRSLLQELGAWDDGWRAPGVGPVTYLQQVGALHEGLLVVHGTQLTREDLDAIAGARATLVLCARSNRWVGAGIPPVREALAAGVRVAIGTDSLASVEDLNLFSELASLRAIVPDVPAAALLRAATRGGAQALRCDALGMIAPGASSRALVRVPPAGVTDVEEWLVAGAVDTADLRWLDALVTHAAPPGPGRVTHGIH